MNEMKLNTVIKNQNSKNKEIDLEKGKLLDKIAEKTLEKENCCLEIKNFKESMGIIYKNKKGKPINRSNYKCYILNRTTEDTWEYKNKNIVGQQTRPKKETKETIELVFNNEHKHDLMAEDVWIITSYSVCGEEYREDQGLKYWKVIECVYPKESSTIIYVKGQRDQEREKEVFKTIERVENSNLTNTELLGILKDRFLTKKIDVTAWPGLFIENKKNDCKHCSDRYKNIRSRAYPIGVRFWLNEDDETDFVIQITESGVWEVDDKEAKPVKDVKLSKATIQQLKTELERRENHEN